MNLSVIARNIGIALVFNAIFMFFGVITSVIYDFDSSLSLPSNVLEQFLRVGKLLKRHRKCQSFVN